eukprot:maker-scaffold48_size466083-snap-gene-2.8 protein:Tk05976 transcript:maker-scaffold48_size466083-snap-gene-2.8-mRNA-1 annotation:"eukaryotic translation initiation factor 4e"
MVLDTFKGDCVTPNVICLPLGLMLSFGLQFFQTDIHRLAGDPDLTWFKFVSRVFSILLGVTDILYWKGLWDGINCLSKTSPIVAVGTLVVGVTVLTWAKALRSIASSPVGITLDTADNCCQTATYWDISFPLMKIHLAKGREVTKWCCNLIFCLWGGFVTINSFRGVWYLTDYYYLPGEVLLRLPGGQVSLGHDGREIRSEFEKRNSAGGRAWAGGPGMGEGWGWQKAHKCVREVGGLAASSPVLQALGLTQPGPLIPWARHPLNQAWSMWLHRNEPGSTWKNNLKFIVSIFHVEEFWGLFNHVEIPSNLSALVDYSLFKKDIQPMWEDPMNRYGGRWLLLVDREFRKTHLDKFWLELCLALVGETFGSEGRLINGVVISIRNKRDKIAVWVSDAGNKEAVLQIGRKIKEVLDLDQSSSLGFEVHEDTMLKACSSPKNLYIL